MAVANIVEIDPVHPQPRVLDRALSALSGGGLVAFPTDTYYGLGCDLFDKRAIERIYLLKQLPRTQELSFICQDLAEIARYASRSETSPLPARMTTGSGPERSMTEEASFGL